MKSQILKSKKKINVAHKSVKPLHSSRKKAARAVSARNKISGGKAVKKNVAIKAGTPKKQINNNSKTGDASQKTFERKSRMPSAAPILEQAEVNRAMTNIVEDQNISDYLKKNISKSAIDVISMLTTPKTDEYISEQLGLKINAVRRILNIMQGYGLTNYYVAKNTNGWLSFAWYINPDKVESFAKQISSIHEKDTFVDENCNDYFICKKCYDDDKLVFTFDAAFEVNFKCACGKNMVAMDRESIKALLKG